jgi:hypothetical protein
MVRQFGVMKPYINEREVKVERLLDISLIFKIKLKMGFFKTQSYDLTIGQGQIILIPLEDHANGRLEIYEEDLKSICITRRNVSVCELEIITETNIYIARLIDRTDLEEVSNVLINEFGCKLIFQDELF